jgi:hypothetical protein
VEVDHQAGVCDHSPDLLEEKATELKMAAYDMLLPAEKKVVDVVEQEYLAYLILISNLSFTLPLRLIAFGERRVVNHFLPQKKLIGLQ